MKWVFTFRVPPPKDEVISVRFGANVMFAAYSTVIQQWFHVYPGGEERIPKPQMWLCTDEYEAAHRVETLRDEEPDQSKRGYSSDESMIPGAAERSLEQFRIRSRRKPRDVQMSLFR